MPRRHVPLLAIAAAIAACSSTAPDTMTTTPPAAAGDAPRTDWAATMQAVERRYQALEQALTQRPVGDLRAVAAAAGEAAELMRLGYGRYEDTSVPDFARMARAAESWFLQIALEARQAHEDIARELFFAERQRHCGDCHDAHDRVHG